LKLIIATNLNEAAYKTMQRAISRQPVRKGNSLARSHL